MATLQPNVGLLFFLFYFVEEAKKVDNDKKIDSWIDNAISAVYYNFNIKITDFATICSQLTNNSLFSSACQVSLLLLLSNLPNRISR